MMIFNVNRGVKIIEGRSQLMFQRLIKYEWWYSGFFFPNNTPTNYKDYIIITIKLTAFITMQQNNKNITNINNLLIRRHAS